MIILYTTNNKKNPRLHSQGQTQSITLEGHLLTITGLLLYRINLVLRIN
nr:MAG TPA: hypothetical protein [Bacteriophage sp.]